MKRDPALDAIVVKRALTAMPGIGQTGETCGGVSGPDIIEHCCGTRYDLGNPEDAKKYVAAGGLQKCVNVVQTTVHIASGILADAAGK